MGMSDLSAALEVCDADQVAKLLAAGADPNTDDEGQSALGLAIENDDAFSAKLLIDAGADVNFRNKHGLSALCFVSSIE